MIEAFKIKLATESDIPAICQLVQQMSPGFTHDYTNAIDKFNLKIKSNPDYYLWVVEFNHEIAGTAMMHLQHKLSYHCGTAAHIEDVVVDTKYRGKGIGKLLMKHAIEIARNNNCYKVILNCYEKTSVFYEELGFKKHDIGMRLELIDPYPTKG